LPFQITIADCAHPALKAIVKNLHDPAAGLVMAEVVPLLWSLS
jgi:hypothetical protein